jgi:hypothetical protein
MSWISNSCRVLCTQDPEGGGGFSPGLHDADEAGVGELLAMACNGDEVGSRRRVATTEARRLEIYRGTDDSGKLLTVDENRWVSHFIMMGRPNSWLHLPHRI